MYLPFRVLPPARRFLAGSAAGVTAVAITYPLDMVRARLAVSRKEKYALFYLIYVKYLLIYRFIDSNQDSDFSAVFKFFLQECENVE